MDGAKGRVLPHSYGWLITDVTTIRARPEHITAVHRVIVPLSFLSTLYTVAVAVAVKDGGPVEFNVRRRAREVGRGSVP